MTGLTFLDEVLIFHIRFSKLSELHKLVMNSLSQLDGCRPYRRTFVIVGLIDDPKLPLKATDSALFVRFIHLSLKWRSKIFVPEPKKTRKCTARN